MGAIEGCRGWFFINICTLISRGQGLLLLGVEGCGRRSLTIFLKLFRYLWYSCDETRRLSLFSCKFTDKFRISKRVSASSTFSISRLVEDFTIYPLIKFLPRVTAGCKGLSSSTCLKPRYTYRRNDKINCLLLTTLFCDFTPVAILVSELASAENDRFIHLWPFIENHGLR